MTNQGYVKGLKYLIEDAITYYRISKMKSYTGVMHRINMGCDIYPREKNFWEWEADKTITVIDKFIYEMTVYDAEEARITSVQVKDKLESIDHNCNPYKWYESKKSATEPSNENENEKKEKEPEWNAEDYAIGLDYLSLKEIS